METRCIRYSKKNRLKRRVKKELLNLPKKIMKNIIYLIVGLIYTIYLLIRAFDDLVAKLFMKLPRWSRAIIIWSLVISNLYHNFESNLNFKNKEVSITSSDVQVLEVVNQVEEEPAEPQIEPLEEEKEKLCIFDEVSCKIAEKGQELDLTDEQILISIAISKWETGNYTSSAFHNKNNVGGMMCNSGLISYSTLDEGINAFLINLRDNYFAIGLDTLEEIQKKYCPIGAKNDPNNLNQYWLSGTQKMLDELNMTK